MNNLTAKHTVAAVILAAGKGTRMNLDATNKVTASLGKKPIIKHIVQFMGKLHINTVVVVVGHAKESVMAALMDENVIYAEQKEQLGTGDALACALEKLPEAITDVFVVYGDDGVIYSNKNIEVMDRLFQTHYSENPAVTFLTIEQENPKGLGRIVRDENDHVLEIVEEKDATDEQRNITEINPGSFVFNVAFLRKYLPLVEKSPATGEYYLTSLIDVALKHNEKVRTVKGGKMAWRGVNTPEELAEANRIFEELS